MSVVNNVEIKVFGDGKEVKPWLTTMKNAMKNMEK